MKNKFGVFVVSFSLFATYLFSQKSQNIKVEVEQVSVDVRVENKKGDLINGLGRGNFKIYEDGVLQEINYFGTSDVPTTYLLITEFSNAIPWQYLYDVLVASYTFVDKKKDDDWMAVIAYDIKPEVLVDFTQNKNEILSALSRLNTPTFSESNLYDTLFEALERLEGVEGRRVIVLVSSGLDTMSKKRLDEILKKVKSSDVTIYPFGIGGSFRVMYDQYLSNDTNTNLSRADAFLRGLAKSTGGEAYFPRFIQDFRSIFENISLQTQNQYLLGYVPDSKKDKKKFRKVKVEAVADVDQDGKPDKLKVIHREGYLSK